MPGVPPWVLGVGVHVHSVAGASVSMALVDPSRDVAACLASLDGGRSSEDPAAAHAGVLSGGPVGHGVYTGRPVRYVRMSLRKSLRLAAPKNSAKATSNIVFDLT